MFRFFGYIILFCGRSNLFYGDFKGTTNNLFKRQGIYLNDKWLYTTLLYCLCHTVTSRFHPANWNRSITDLFPLKRRLAHQWNVIILSSPQNKKLATFLKLRYPRVFPTLENPRAAELNGNEIAVIYIVVSRTWRE